MFSKCKNNEDGLQNQCKNCNRKYYEENKEKRNKYQNKYNAERREELKKYANKHYHTNKGMYRKSYLKSRVKIDSYRVQWRKNNKNKTREYNKKYQQKINELPHTLTEEEWLNALKEFDYKCAYCGYEEETGKDHFIPVSKNGSYTKDNILPSCKRCNSSKHNNDFFEWYPEQEYYNKDRKIHILNYLGYEEL